MMPDVIVCWPHTCDYPLWRKFIRDERSRFAKVLVAFTTNTQGPHDYRVFVREQIGDIADCFDSPDLEGRDWRDVAVNAALDRSTADWVWFTEQDFRIVKPELFWRGVEIFSEFDAILGWEDDVPRWHPSCLFVLRSIIEEDTSRYFGPEPRDHFARFSDELHREWDSWDIDEDLWEHLQGLSQNHFLIDTGQTEGIFQRERFREYLRDCLNAGVTLDPFWRANAKREVALVTA